MGVLAEAFVVSQMPPPWMCMMWSRLAGSIATPSTQPAQSPAAMPVCGMLASASCQARPSLSDNWMSWFESAQPVTPRAMRVVGPVPDTDRPAKPTLASNLSWFQVPLLLAPNL